MGEAKIGHRYNNNKNDNLHVSICIKDYFVKKRIRLHLPVRKLKIYDLINNKWIENKGVVKRIYKLLFSVCMYD